MLDIASIHTVKGLRRAIKAVPPYSIYCLVRFGVSGKNVRISKAEALHLVQGLPGKTTASDMEMYTGSFGYVENSVLYLG